MIDNFAIFISHALLALMIWRLWQRPDLDYEENESATARFGGRSQSGRTSSVPDSPGAEPPVGPPPVKGFRNRA